VNIPITDFGTGVTSKEAKILAWRDEQFTAMGFGLAQSALLACSKADLHDARELVKRGCPLHLAFDILR